MPNADIWRPRSNNNGRKKTPKSYLIYVSN